MALWGQLSQDNRVIQATVGSDSDPDGGYDWLIRNLGGRWVEISHDGSTGDMPAGVGSLYCDTHSSFACQNGCDFGDFWREQKSLPEQEASRRTWFMGRAFACNPDRYVPPMFGDEIQRAVESVIAYGPSRIADIGSGIGTLGVTIGAETGAQVVLVEPDPGQLSISGANAEAYGVDATLVHGVSADLAGAFDVIISDAPCWPEDSLEVRVAGHAAANGGGEDGLDVLREVVAAAERTLIDDGLIALRYVAEPLLTASGRWRDIKVVDGIVTARIQGGLAPAVTES